jgi:hypothetical protein
VPSVAVLGIGCRVKNRRHVLADTALGDLIKSAHCLMANKVGGLISTYETTHSEVVTVCLYTLSTIFI